MLSMVILLFFGGQFRGDNFDESRIVNQTSSRLDTHFIINMHVDTFKHKRNVTYIMYDDFDLKNSMTLCLKPGNARLAQELRTGTY